MKFLTKTVLIVLLLAATLFAKDIATVTALKGKAFVERDGNKIALTLGSSLQEKDRILTDDKTKVQIIFKDETVITIGKKSNFSIKKYMFEESKEPVARFAMLKGAMRTITGKIGKIAPNRFSVKTKTATIGIRGTNFTIIAGNNGNLKVYCTYGAISVTINGKEAIVPHDFYFYRTPDGKSEVKAFTPHELQNMRNKHFEKVVALKSKTSKDGAQPQSDVILDNTTAENAIVVKDVTDSMRDAVQAEHNKDAQDPETPDNPIPTPTPAYITMKGFSVDTDYDTLMSAVTNLRFLSDGSSFDTNSYVEVLNQWNQNENSDYVQEYDNWKFTLASTPSSFTNRDNFTTSFSSVIVSPVEYSSTQDVQLIDSSFSATTDLSTDDKMSWGTWNATVAFKSGNDDHGTLADRTKNFHGLWVSGVPTDASVLDGLNTTRTYDGKFQAYQTGMDTPKLETGIATLSVDFGADTADLTIHNNSDNGGTIFGNYTYDMARRGNQIKSTAISSGTGLANGTLTRSNNQLYSTESNSVTGTANGTFYGADGKSVGGNFHISDSSNAQVKGVYEVQAP